MIVERRIKGRTLHDDPKYPGAVIEYNLNGETGNAFSILAMTERALKGEGASKEELALFHKQATRGDYHDLRATVAMWVFAVEFGKLEDDPFDEDYDEDDD